jgi:hypothetical protein
MLDLYHADRAELIRIILAQQAEIAQRDRQLAAQAAEIGQLRALIGQLTERLGKLEQASRNDPPSSPGTSRGMPGLKPTDASERTSHPRKPRAKGAGRQRMMVTERVVHALAVCPDCQTPLAGGSVKRTREVIDLPRPRVIVTEHVYLERRCPVCGKRCVPKPDLGRLVSGHRRFGHRLNSLLALLRDGARLPIAQIQSLIETVSGLRLSVGGIVASVAAVAERAQPVMAQLADRIRASPVVHVDETGWREDGHNGYVWTFTTPEVRLFQHGRRSTEMFTAVVDATFAGVVVSDFYGVYTSYEGGHQYCWAHLLRDIHDLTVQYPDDAAVRGWATAVHAIFSAAQDGATGTRTERWAIRHHAEADLNALCSPWLDEPAAQAILCRRIVTQLSHLFVFVTELDVPATNNAAERSLRPLVVARKISGGTRSARGTTTRLTLASLFGTWRAQGRNPYDECLALLASPQL